MKCLTADQAIYIYSQPRISGVIIIYDEDCSDIRGFYSHTTLNIRKWLFFGHPKMAEQLRPRTQSITVRLIL